LEVHGYRPAARGTDDNRWLALVISRLGLLAGSLEVIIIQRGIDYLVAFIPEESRFDTARYGVPTMKEQNLGHAKLQQ
jgi:hypothetical protein